ncbi:NifB/NifX family molybdenum-iron cluster-binding protein [Pseudodesulfovibrio tunisiensis]|uniref:NifB/NifX family molybdenum-iron cluster-binding protein n=1 Tax=Pseudodesulfovibrio tunisiensis TaxID=463192 RepID=UPI001FB3A739|nr:NifB/NifX family molybdenum-iron cluster-binding protein [Pseudodesulfovibrio tunisiensis]
MEKILIPLLENDVAPRFDLATDVLVVTVVRLDSGEVAERGEKVVVLDQASPEAVCRLVITESVGAVLCAGIEEEYYDFLKWKGVTVVDDVCGSVDAVLNSYLSGELSQGEILY